MIEEEYSIKDLVTGITTTAPIYKLKEIIPAPVSSIKQLVAGKYNHIGSRYIESNNKNTFILFDCETQEEFECISNATIFVHLNIE